MGCLGNDPPDPAKGYVAGVNADLENLPSRRIIEAMALLGESGTVNIPGRGDQTFDFTGLGEADYQRQYADQLSAQLLQLQRDLGPAYVEQRLAELEASDPEGAAMRRQLWGTIKSGIEAGPTARPGAEALQAQILADLERGGTLDEKSSGRVTQGVLGGQVARGNWQGNAPATEEAMALTQAGEAQAAKAQQDALTFLTTGVSPDDAAYREGQQNIANLGAFLAGETPVAQFGQLSGAQNGVVPFQGGGNSQVGVNANAGWEGVNFANQQYNMGQQAAQNQVNPWVAGLSGALQGVNVWAGWGGGAGTAGGHSAGAAAAAGGW